MLLQMLLRLHLGRSEHTPLPLYIHPPCSGGLLLLRSPVLPLLRQSSGPRHSITCAQSTLLGDSPEAPRRSPEGQRADLAGFSVHAVSPSHGGHALWQPTTPCRPTRHVLHPGGSATVPRAASGLYGGRLHGRAQLAPEGATHPVCACGFHYGSSCMSPRLLSQGALLKRDDFVRQGCRSLLSKSYESTMEAVLPCFEAP